MPVLYDPSMMEAAFKASAASECNRLKVGASMAGQLCQFLATGFNISPYGRPCDCSPEGPRCTNTVHAEIDCLARCGVAGAEGATMYVTHQPCLTCASAVVSAGIAAVFFGASYGTDEGVEYLRRRGVEVQQVTMEI